MDKRLIESIETLKKVHEESIKTFNEVILHVNDTDLREFILEKMNQAKMSRSLEEAQFIMKSFQEGLMEKINKK